MRLGVQILGVVLMVLMDQSLSQELCAFNACLNGGICELYPGSQRFECNCSPCFSGVNCETSVDACQNNKCENGAQCKAVAGSCTDYTCECNGCFQGDFCAEAAQSPCFSSPCANGGVCTNIGSFCSFYECICLNGFTGFNCDQALAVNSNPCNSFPCESGSTCIDKEDDSYICVCPPEYSGGFCNVALADYPLLDSCDTSPCLSGGTCRNQYDSTTSSVQYVNQYTCICPEGLTGPNCAFPTHIAPLQDACIQEGTQCLNGAQCLNTYSSVTQSYNDFCVCPIGFDGELCEIQVTNPCASNPCPAGIQCTPFNSYFVCECPPNLTGPTCEIEMTNNPPTILCPEFVQEVNVPLGQSASLIDLALARNLVLPAASDIEDATPTVTYFPNTISRGQDTAVVALATDAAGNFAFCTFQVKVPNDNDNPPTILCPEFVQEVIVPLGQTASLIDIALAGNLVLPAASDIEDGTPTVTYFPNTISRGQTTAVVALATDAAGNIALCAFQVNAPNNTASSEHAYYHKQNEWRYYGSEGPSSWPVLFPQYCLGTSQSPINIDPSSAISSSEGRVELHGFGFPIPSPSARELTNNGHTVEVVVTGDFYIKGGPLKATYQTAQFHFHWGSVNSQGSEHALGGQHFPAEMHIVHWDRDNYTSIQEAIKHKNGLAVLGIFIKVGNHNHAFQTIADAIDNIGAIKHKGDTFYLPPTFAIDGLMPEYQYLNDYFFYEGSLTTPACNEVVQWIVYQEPIEISQQQLDALRSVYLNTKEGGVPNIPLTDNFRQTQSGRKVYHAGH